MASTESAPGSLLPSAEDESETNDSSSLDNLRQSRDNLQQSEATLLRLLGQASDADKEKLQTSLHEVQQQLQEKAREIDAWIDNFLSAEPNAESSDNPESTALSEDAMEPAPPLPDSEASTSDTTEQKSVTIENIKQAPKYGYIVEKNTEPPDESNAQALIDRSHKIEAVLRNQPGRQADLFRAEIGAFATKEALQEAWNNQRAGRALPMIPDAFFRNQEFVREVKAIGQRMAAGKELTQMMQEAYQEGKNGNRLPLRALKTVGIMMMHKYSPGRDRAKWEALSEDGRASVRLGEILSMSADMNLLQLHINEGKLPPDIAEYRRREFIKYAQSDDLPQFVKRDMQKTVGQLERYQRAAGKKHERVNVPEDSSSIFDEPVSPPAVGETMTGSDSPTTIEKTVEPEVVKPEEQQPETPSNKWEKVTKPLATEKEPRSTTVVDVDSQPVSSEEDSTAQVDEQEYEQGSHPVYLDGRLRQKEKEYTIDDALLEQQTEEFKTYLEQYLPAEEIAELDSEELFEKYTQTTLLPRIESLNVAGVEQAHIVAYLQEISRELENEKKLAEQQELPPNRLQQLLWFSGIGTIINGSKAAARLNARFTARRDLLGWRKAALSFFRPKERRELFLRRQQIAARIKALGEESHDQRALVIARQLEKLNLRERVEKWYDLFSA